MIRFLALLLSSAVLATLAGCGSSGASDPGGASAKEGALELAAQACNSAMEDMSDLAAGLDERQQAADIAAEAATKDETWDSLATAVNQWAFTLKTFNESDDGDDMSLSSLQKMSDDLLENKAELSAQCRKVKSAGGTVDQDVLDNF